MERDVYQRLADNEIKHWWWRARRDILRATISKLSLPSGDATILDAGCGTGGNLSMLGEFGEIAAFEFDDTARDIASRRLGADIPFGALPDQLPFEGRLFELITLFDVLEHIEADTESLIALKARLKPGGLILVTVPAFQSLWSHHDETHHHYRRYTKRSLADTADKAELEVINSYYFNSLLFPLAVGTRALKSALGREEPDDKMPSHGTNELLYRIFSLEKNFIETVKLPFGLSLCATLGNK